MALTAPIAPKNFYVGGLQGLKDALEQANAPATGGIIALVSALPANIESCWETHGVGADGSTGVGTTVIGYKYLELISEVVAGDQENDPLEIGYKLTFDPIDDLVGTVEATAIAMVLVVGRETHGTNVATPNEDIRYIIDITPLDVKVASLYNIPTFDIEIQYGTNKVVV